MSSRSMRLKMGSRRGRGAAFSNMEKYLSMDCKSLCQIVSFKPLPKTNRIQRFCHRFSRFRSSLCPGQMLVHAGIPENAAAHHCLVAILNVSPGGKMHPPGLGRVFM